MLEKDFKSGKENEREFIAVIPNLIGPIGFFTQNPCVLILKPQLENSHNMRCR